MAKRKKVEKKAKKVFGDSTHVFKGNAPDGGRGVRHGWFARPFGKAAQFIGGTLAEAEAVLDQRLDK